MNEFKRRYDMNLATGRCFCKLKKSENESIYIPNYGSDIAPIDLIIIDRLSTDQDDNIEKRYEKEKPIWKGLFETLKMNPEYKNTEVIILYKGSINLDGTLEGIGVPSDLTLEPIKLKFCLGADFEVNIPDTTEIGFC